MGTAIRTVIIGVLAAAVVVTALLLGVSSGTKPASIDRPVVR